MPRQPKPYYRKAQNRWVCTINGTRITLGEDRDAAFAKFHELMLDKSALNSHISTLYDLSQVFLDWVQDYRSEGTYNRHRPYLKKFIEHVGKRLCIGDLKPFHITKWLSKHPTWGSTTQSDAVKTVQRMLNWSIEQGYINSSPIAKFKKPARSRREVFYTQRQWEVIRSHVHDGFIDYLDFLWLTGCRPKEARDLQGKHVDLENNLVVFESSEAKGKMPRVVFLIPESRAIVERLLAKYKEGYLFRNRNGNQWTKDSVKCRLTRISTKVGFRVIAYGTRHSYVTEGLKNGVDSITLAHLVGHKDTSMIAKVYSHLAKNMEFLSAQAAKVKSA